MFFQSELKFHGGDLSATLCSMKEYLHHTTLTSVLNDNFPGFIARHFPKLEELKDRFNEQRKIAWVFNMIHMIIMAFFDIINDFAVMLIILFGIGGPGSLYDFPTK